MRKANGEENREKGQEGVMMWNLRNCKNKPEREKKKIVKKGRRGKLKTKGENPERREEQSNTTATRMLTWLQKEKE